MTEKRAYDAGRRCDNCGAKSAPWKPRKRKGDDMLCDSCYNGKTAVKDGDIVAWDFDPDHDYQVLENPESGEVGIQRLQAAEGDVGRVVPVDELTVLKESRRKTAAEWKKAPYISEDRQYLDIPDTRGYGEGFTISVKPNDDGTWQWTVVLARNPSVSGTESTEAAAKAAAIAEYESRTGKKVGKVAHDSPGTDILRHCPFCGAGQLTGRSDGTVECGFCDATFTVQTQPNLPSTPQTVGDELYMHPEMSEPGVPEDEINPDEPEESVLPLTEEESGNGIEDGDNPFDDIEKMTFRIGNATVPAGEYIKHLALKYADDRGVVLREIQSSRRK